MSRDRSILEGNRNNFHAVANHRNRKKKIECLRDPARFVYDTPKILKVAANYYKMLFGRESRGNFSLQGDFWEVEDKVTSEENETLQAPFLEEEVKGVLFSCYLEGAPRPDGLHFLFFQKFWDVVKKDFLDLVRSSQEGKLYIFRLKFVMLTLIPKV
jgi:hypothetical protein